MLVPSPGVTTYLPTIHTLSAYCRYLHILKDYILTRYMASAFNTCKKQPLPLMQDSPPLKLFVDEDATPVAEHSPFLVPIHWQAQVKAGLDRDVRLADTDIGWPLKASFVLRTCIRNMQSRILGTLKVM